MKNFLAAIVVVLGLSGCAGYRIGNVKPRYLEGVHTIAVPAFRNQTFAPRIEVLLANTVIKQLQQDGTYRVANEGQADAVLKGTIRGLGRTPARSLRGNVLATTEFNLNITLSYTLVARDGRVLAGPAAVSGTTSFFTGTDAATGVNVATGGADVTTDERQALPLAMEDLAVRLASQLSEGW